MVKLPWIAVLVTLAAAVVLLFGPLWTTSVGENPLDRRGGVDYGLVLRLGLPTVMVLASLGAAIAGRRHRVIGAAALLVFGYAVWSAPLPLPGWFVPGLVLSVLGYGWLCWGAQASGRPMRTRQTSGPLSR